MSEAILGSDRMREPLFPFDPDKPVPGWALLAPERAPCERLPKLPPVHAMGEGHWSAKLTNSDVYAIRRLFDAREFTCSETGERFGVSERAVRQIGIRDTWRHLPEETRP